MQTRLPTSRTARRVFLAILIGIVPALVLACTGGSAPEASGAKPDRKAAAEPLVLATTLPLYDFARTIAGEDARVELLPPPGIGIHGYAASLKDRERLMRSSLVFANGLGLEPWLDGALVEELRGRGVNVVLTAEAIPHSELRTFGDPHWWDGIEKPKAAPAETLPSPTAAPVAISKPAGPAPVRRSGAQPAPAPKPAAPTTGHTSDCGCPSCAGEAAEKPAETHDHDHADGACPVCGGHHGPKDSHVWLWRRGMEVQIGEIEKALAALLPERAASFSERAAGLRAELAGVYEAGREALTPHRGRGMITFHDAWAYFAKDMGIRVVGVVTPVPGIGGSLRNREALQNLMKSGDACAVFVEPRMDPMFTTQVAESVGARVHVLDPMESTGDLAGFSVAGVMRANIESLGAAFGG